MDDSHSVSGARLFLIWATLVVVALPVGWVVSDFISGPIGWLLWGTILLGAQWALLQFSASDASWAVVVLANAGLITAFEFILRAAAGDPLAAMALIVLVPALTFLIGLLVIAVFAMPVGIISLVSLRLGPVAERRQKFREAASWVRVRSRTLARLYLVYLGGVLIGSAVAFLVNATVAQILLANDAYLGHILVRAGYGLIVVLYVWSVANALRRDLLWNDRVGSEGDDVSKV